MFKRKKRRVLSMADMSTRTRGFILDSQIQHAHEISVLLGCAVISDEGAEHEENESDKRVARLGSLMPLLYAYAKTIADGTVSFQLKNLPDELGDISEEIWSASQKMMEDLAFSVLVGAISQLIDMELISIPKENK